MRRGETSPKIRRKNIGQVKFESYYLDLGYDIRMNEVVEMAQENLWKQKDG